MKTVLIFIIAIVSLVSAGCGKQENSAEDREESSASQSIPPPPVMDLHMAAATGNLEVIRQRIEAGSDLNVRDPEGGACPLSTAALFGQTEAAAALIEAGADIDCMGNDGATPLHVAAFFCRTEIVRALVDKGADKSIKNSYGSTPFETVSGPWEGVKTIYEHFGKTLGPAGLKLDYERLEATRPEIAKMLQ